MQMVLTPDRCQRGNTLVDLQPVVQEQTAPPVGSKSCVPGSGGAVITVAVETRLAVAAMLNPWIQAART